MARRAIEINEDDLRAQQPRRVIEIRREEVQSLPVVVVTKPVNGETLHLPHLTVLGRREGHGPICLWNGTLHQICQNVTPQGGFEFKHIPLAPQENLLSVGSHGDQCGLGRPGRVSIRVLYTDPFLGNQTRDPYVKQLFHAGDDVVRCACCKTYFLRSTTEVERCCPICRGENWVCHPSPLYYAPKVKA